VGVFAVRDIPKGTLIFAPDDDQTIEFAPNQVAALQPEFRRLYQDFCPQSATGYYTCPLNFNKLTVAWYLNDSDTPNVQANEELQFLAARDIRQGEELLCSYKDLIPTDGHK
jgi:SET domain-containing protein